MPREPQQISSATPDPAELRQLLGAPPVLSTENVQSYHEILARLMQCLAPRDFVEETLIKELTDCTWEVARYTRLKTLGMERGFREHLRFPRQDALAERLAAERLADGNRERAGEGDGVRDSADAIAVELDHAHALEVTLDYHERVDKLLITATARRNNVLEQIERYRDRLGGRLRRVSDEIVTDQIIEAQSDAIERQPGQVAATLVPSEAPQP